MNEETVKTLESRVLDAVARIRSLRSECDRRGEECAALRARVGDLEREGASPSAQEGGETFDKVRAALREAIRELREEEEPPGDPGKLPGEGAER